MTTLIFVLHIISCLFLIGLILIQKTQGAEMGAAFGGASQTVFGSRGPATFLNKLTTIVAVIFLSASIYLAREAKHAKEESVVDEARPSPTEPAVAPAPTTNEQPAKEAGEKPK